MFGIIIHYPLILLILAIIFMVITSLHRDLEFGVEGR